MLHAQTRFDKGKVNEGNWLWSNDSNFAKSLGVTDHDILISGIEKAKKLVFKVGDQKSVVDLTGGARAVAEYRKRCAALGRL